MLDKNIGIWLHGSYRIAISNMNVKKETVTLNFQRKSSAVSYDSIEVQRGYNIAKTFEDIRI
jgi:hypothetical protein